MTDRNYPSRPPSRPRPPLDARLLRARRTLLTIAVVVVVFGAAGLLIQAATR